MSLNLFASVQIQLDPGYLNSVILNSPLFRTQNHFPRLCSSVIYYHLFWTLGISNYSIFWFPCEFEMAGFYCCYIILPYIIYGCFLLLNVIRYTYLIHWFSLFMDRIFSILSAVLRIGNINFSRVWFSS